MSSCQAEGISCSLSPNYNTYILFTNIYFKVFCRHGPDIITCHGCLILCPLNVKQFQGDSFAFLDTVLLQTTKKAAFFSSDESEEEEDQRKKFKIKIKPLPADQVVAVPSVDELKASIGNIALSPSPLVSRPDINSLFFMAFLNSGLSVHLPQVCFGVILQLFSCFSDVF